MAILRRKVIAREDWEKVMNSVDIIKEDMNKLVMNFLVRECNEEAVENFIKESGTKPDMDLEKMQVRANIRRKILCGDIVRAQRCIDSSVHVVSPDFYEEGFWLNLSLQLITELIREGKVEEAVKFGQQCLSRYTVIPRNLQDFIEKTFCLLAFEDTSNCLLAEHLDVYRMEIANAVNRALLTQEGQREKLDIMLKELLWVQRLNNVRAAYPQINISSGILEYPVI